MRVNIYAEEMTDRVEVIAKECDGTTYTGLRIYLELPVTVPQRYVADGQSPQPQQIRGPFMHRPGDDDSSAVTFWGKRDLREVLKKALDILDKHYAAKQPHPENPESRAMTTPVPPADVCPKCGAGLSVYTVGYFVCNSVRYPDGKFVQSVPCKDNQIAELERTLAAVTAENALLAVLLEQGRYYIVFSEAKAKRERVLRIGDRIWVVEGNDSVDHHTAIDAIRAAMATETKGEDE